MSSLFECPKVGGKECRIGITLLEQWLIRQSRHKKRTRMEPNPQLVAFNTSNKFLL